MSSDQESAAKLDQNEDLIESASEVASQGLTSVEEESQDNASSGSGKNESREGNLNLILDIPLRVTVELGRTKMVVSELLNLGQGSVIELSKLAGEPMEVLVNDKLVARGEAVVVNEKFGVRLTDIISPTERVEQLGG